MILLFPSMKCNVCLADFPSSGPSISSQRQQYQVGETAHLTCSAPKSKPPTLLAWYINGEPVSERRLQASPRVAIQ